MTTESSKNGAMPLSRANFCGYVGHTTMFTTACCLVVRLGFDFVSRLVSDYTHVFIVLSVVIVPFPLLPNTHLVLVEVSKVVDDDGYRQCNDEHPADTASGTNQLAPYSRRAHVAIANRCHGDRGPPERLRDADKGGALDVVFGEVGETREDQHADCNEHHQQSQFLRQCFLYFNHILGLSLRLMCFVFVSVCLCHGRTGPPGCQALASWAGWSAGQVGRLLKC